MNMLKTVLNYVTGKKPEVSVEVEDQMENQMENQAKNKSKWGYHPCDFEFYSKLKKLKKWYWQTHYDFYRWSKWNDLTKNRKGTEPKYCPVFTKDNSWKDYLDNKAKGVVVIKHEKILFNFGISDLFETIRKPHETVQPPLDQAIVNRVNQLYFACKAYYEGSES